MNKTPPEIKKLSDILMQLSEASGLRFACHFINMDWAEGLDKSLRYHTCSFCGTLRKESSGGMFQKCHKEHYTVNVSRAIRERRMFFTNCHAGALELAIPLFIKGEFNGLLYIGTFRSQEHCIYQENHDEWKNLPEIHPEQLSKWGTLVENLLRQYLENLEISSGDTPLLRRISPTDTRIMRSVLYIRKNFQHRISTTEVAKHAGISVSHFLHLFPGETGYSFSDFIQRIRVEHARKLVMSSDLPLGEIASCSGIAPQSRLGVLFRRYLGTTPGKLREQSHKARIE